MKKDLSQQDAFFALLRAGLWEQSVRLLPFSPLDFDAVYKLAEEQSVVGLIAAGLEHVEDITLSKQQVMPYMKQVISLEHRNTLMNIFIGNLIEKMRAFGIQALLVKGQGIGQCYERPLLRSAGDVDLLFDAVNYERAKVFLLPYASSSEKEGDEEKHFGMKIDSWEVELHGTLHSTLSNSLDEQIDRIQDEVFNKNAFRVWDNARVDVFIPHQDSDIIFVFTHILRHFFRGGIGLRQICDWCRLLWTYREDIDRNLLESRVRKMKLMTEWRAFGAYAVDYLGMPVEAVPLYCASSFWKRKADRINSFILHVGNFGHNRDNSYFNKPFIVRKTISFNRHLGDFFCHLTISPITSMRVFCRTVLKGIKAAIKGE